MWINLISVTHSFILTVIGSIVLCLIVISLCAFVMRKRLWRCAKSYATKQSRSSVEGAGADAGEASGGGETDLTGK